MTQVVDPAAYRYQADLPDAIDAYLAALRRTQMYALTYRGADLSRLIGIEIYFRLINDPGLREAYRSFDADGQSVEFGPRVPLSEWAVRIYPYLAKVRSASLPAFSRVMSFISASTQCLIASVRARRECASVVKSGPGVRPVAMLALSRRFFLYLLPIRHSINGPVCWLIPEDASWASEIEALGDAISRIKDIFEEPPQGFISLPLQNWTLTLQRFDAYLDALWSVDPAVVVVVEGNHPEDEIVARVAEIAGARSLCLQQGWSPFIHSGFRRMRFDAFCAWGKAFADMLAPYNPRQRFMVTGSPVVSPVEAKVNAAAKAISFFLQRDSLVISEASWRGMLEFVDWCAATFPEWQILVREHPAIPFFSEDFARIRQRANVTFCPASDISLQEVLDRSRIAVAIFSTTLIESLARRVAPLIVNVTGAPRYYPDLAAQGVAIEVHDYEEARAKMADLIEGGADAVIARMPEVVDKYFGVAAVDALVNIVREIHQLEAS